MTTFSTIELYFTFFNVSKWKIFSTCRKYFFIVFDAERKLFSDGASKASVGWSTQQTIYIAVVFLGSKGGKCPWVQQNHIAPALDRAPITTLFWGHPPPPPAFFFKWRGRKVAWRVFWELGKLLMTYLTWIVSIITRPSPVWSRAKCRNDLYIQWKSPSPHFQDIFKVF